MRTRPERTCRTRRWSARKSDKAGRSTVQTKTKNHTFLCGFCFGNRHRHILPGRVQPSTFCTAELNFCVRYENRWDLSVIDTGIVEGRRRFRASAHSQLHNRKRFLLIKLGLGKLYLLIEALGLLVSVSLTHCCAYTPDLSTLWSTRGLTQISL